jgi:hypothetical protein
MKKAGAWARYKIAMSDGTRYAFSNPSGSGEQE